MEFFFYQSSITSGVGIQEHSHHSTAMLKSHSIDDILGLKAAAAVHAARAVAALAVTRHNEMVHLNSMGNVRPPQLVTSSSNISNSGPPDGLKQLFEGRPPSSASPPSSSSSSNVLASTASGTHLDESQYSDKGIKYM